MYVKKSYARTACHKYKISEAIMSVDNIVSNLARGVQKDLYTYDM